eukprot:scaffold185313_cov36-Tisochrysis_lutea.AAC.2
MLNSMGWHYADRVAAGCVAAKLAAQARPQADAARVRSCRFAMISTRKRFWLLNSKDSALLDASDTNIAVADALRAGKVTSRQFVIKTGRPCGESEGACNAAHASAAVCLCLLVRGCGQGL